MSLPRVVVIGAGMAGLTAAHGLSSVCEVTVVDKARGVGGRLSTRRIGEATLDHGAQFITTHTSEFAEMVQRWVDDGVVTDWFRGRIGPQGETDPDGHLRFRGQISMNAVAKKLAETLDVRTASPVSALIDQGDRWVVSMADGTELAAEGIVVTAPVPQTLALLTNGGVALSAEDLAALTSIAYEPCLALMTVLDGPSGLPAPGAVDPTAGPIDWMADNQLKGISAVPAVTIHATAEFSRTYWDEADKEIADLLLAAASLDAAVVPETTQIQRWLYAQPTVLHPEKFLRIGGVAPLVCAGDAFGGAKVEGAALSGVAAAEALLAALDGDG